MTDAWDDRAIDGTGDLALFLGSSPDSFTGKLLELIVKAQATPENMARLELAFPYPVTAWRTWMSMSPEPTFGELRAELNAREQGMGRTTPGPGSVGAREWRVCTGGEKLFSVIGPEAEAMVRMAAAANGGTVSYREPRRPSEANGYSLHGPWIDAP